MVAGRKPKVRPEPLPHDPSLEKERLEDLGKRVAQCREKRGLSRPDLSGLSGIHRNEIMLIEAGKVDPKTGTMCRLGDALGCSRSWLTYGEGEAP